MYTAHVEQLALGRSAFSEVSYYEEWSGTVDCAGRLRLLQRLGQEALRLGDGQRVGWSGVTGVDVSL